MRKPNQRIIQVKRSSDTAKKDYFKISNRNLQIAMYYLKGNTFKLWCYLADNADGYSFDLYPIDFTKVAGVSYDSYKQSFDKLIEMGYLLPHNSKPNVFMFVEESVLNLEPPTKYKDQAQSLPEEEFNSERAKNYQNTHLENQNETF